VNTTYFTKKTFDGFMIRPTAGYLRYSELVDIELSIFPEVIEDSSFFSWGWNWILV